MTLKDEMVAICNNFDKSLSAALDNHETTDEQEDFFQEIVSDLQGVANKLVQLAGKVDEAEAMLRIVMPSPNWWAVGVLDKYGKVVGLADNDLYNSSKDAENWITNLLDDEDLLANAPHGYRVVCVIDPKEVTRADG